MATEPRFYIVKNYIMHDSLQKILAASHPFFFKLGVLNQKMPDFERTLGNVKIGLYCYVTADILTTVLQKCFLRRPLSNISFLSKLLNLIGCHGHRKVKYEKN